MKRILVVGSESWTDRERIRAALLEYGPGVVVHGCTPGAEATTLEVAEDLGCLTEGHPAKWHGGVAKRYAHMVELGADVCLGFIIPNDANEAWFCTRRALSAGIPVRIYREAT